MFEEREEMYRYCKSLMEILIKVILMFLMGEMFLKYNVKLEVLFLIW